MRNPAETLAAIGAALDKLEALEKAATKGPWKQKGAPNNYKVMSSDGQVANCSVVLSFAGGVNPTTIVPTSNASLIAASRLFVPGALAYMRADYERLVGLQILRSSDLASGRYVDECIARLATALGIEVQP